MDRKDWQFAKEVLHEALELEAGSRRAFVENAPGLEEPLRKELISILSADEKLVAFLSEPLAELDSRPEEKQPRLPKQIAGYQVLGMLGQGGMAKVFLARQTKGLKREVAIKVLKQGLDRESFIRRFQAEQQILAELKHPSIAKIFDAGTLPSGLPYFVMEYVVGKNILGYCDDRRLSTKKRLKLFLAVCEAVSFAHQSFIIHRDLKPANILVTRDGRPIVLDFGIAKLLKPGELETQTALPPRTPEYASPEQIRGEKCGAASDVYSLGVLLYELLTGRRPYYFKSRNALEVERVIAGMSPKKPSEAVFQPHAVAMPNGSAKMQAPRAACQARGGSPKKLAGRLRGDLDNIVMTALEKEPSRRYASVEQLAADLDRHLNGHPVQARPPTAVYQLNKFMRRNKLLVFTIILALLLPLSFAITQYSGQRKAALERDIALRERARAERVSGFMVGLFQASNPYNSDRAEITAREMVDHAARELEEDLDEDPKVKANLMRTIGDIYLHIGLYQESRSMLEKSLALYRTHLPGSLDLSENLILLGQTQRWLAEYPAARASFREALAIRSRHLGAETPGNGVIFNGLANIQLALGNFNEARRLVERGLRVQSRLEGPQREDRSYNLLLSGVIHNLQNQFSEAEADFRQALALIEEIKGSNHPATGVVCSFFGEFYYQQGQFVDAEPLLLRTLAIQQDWPIKGPEVGANKMILAATYRELARYDEAAALLDEVIPHFRETYGEENRQFAMAINQRALLHRDLGEFQQAIPLFRRSLEIVQSTLGEEHRAAAFMHNYLGDMERERGNDGEAEALIRKALSIREKNFGAQHLEYAQSLQTLARLYQARQNWRQAIDLYRKTLAIYDEKYARPHPLQATCHHQLALCFQALSQEQAADFHNERSRQIREATIGPNHPLVAENNALQSILRMSAKK